MKYSFYLANYFGVCVLFLRILFISVLSVYQLSDLCLAWGLSVCASVLVMFGMGVVCLCVSTSYVWHGVFLFVRQY